jgi:hypothetical protein
VVLVERLREVRALVGFTRIGSPGDFNDVSEVPGDRQMPMSRRPPQWVPASKVRGEGIFIRFDEAEISAWCGTDVAREREHEFLSAHRQWRRMRNIEPPDAGFPGIRYVLLHSFAHTFIRQLALSSGYTAASIRERIYARDPGPQGEPMAGVLLYTAAPDSEGTLGGLVSLGETDVLGTHLDAALEQVRLCASDPLCAEHAPQEAVLHGVFHAVSNSYLSPLRIYDIKWGSRQGPRSANMSLLLPLAVEALQRHRKRQANFLYLLPLQWYVA